MADPEVLAAAATLRKHDVRFIVIGGQAIALRAATTTRDIDVMVATPEYEQSLEKLRKDPDLVYDWGDEHVARFRIRTIGGAPLDIVNAATFSGRRSGAEFFDYLLGQGSFVTDGIPFATPELVWYTRLLTKRWKAYAEKIITNVIDGLSPDLLVRVAALGQRFGTERELDPRIAYVREELKRPDIAELVRRP